MAEETTAPAKKAGIPFFVQIIIGFVAGIAVGAIFGEGAAVLSPLGDLFMKFLKMLIMPLVFSALVTGITSVPDVKSILNMGVKSLVLFIGATAVAIVVGIAFAVALQPGVGSTAVLPASTDVTATEVTMVEMLLSMFPTNIFESLSKGDVLQVVIFGIFTGISIMLAGEKAEPVKRFFHSMSEVMYKMTDIVIKFTPIGVFGIMAGVVGKSGLEALIPLGKFIIDLHVALVFFIFVVLGALVWIGAKVNPITYFRGIFKAIMMALATDSSAAAMPVAIQELQDNLGVSEGVASFVMGVGTNVCKTGSVLYQVMAVVFISQLVGTPLGMPQLVTLGVTALLSGLGMGSIPSASIVMLSAELLSVGLPLEGVSLMAGIDRIIGGQRTCPNTIGNAVIAGIIERDQSGKELEVTV